MKEQNHKFKKNTGDLNGMLLHSRRMDSDSSAIHSTSVSGVHHCSEYHRSDISNVD